MYPPAVSSAILKASMAVMKSGVDVKSLVIPGENPDELEDLVAEYYERYRPSGLVECHLVDSLITDDWRLRRYRKVPIPKIEAMVQRSYKRTLKELERTQAQRRATEFAGWDKWEGGSTLIH